MEPGRAKLETGARVRVGAEFFLAHGLGNDYLVFSRAEEEAPPGTESPPPPPRSWPLHPETVRRICHRTLGLGSDGIVVLLDPDPADGIFPLRMFNPDGSEFERSGNGLRVLGAWLHARGWVGEAPFRVRSGGSVIGMQVLGRTSDGSLDLSVQMGRARVGAEAVELSGAEEVAGDGGAHRLAHPTRGPIPFHPVSVGNPHAVVFPDRGVGADAGSSSDAGSGSGAGAGPAAAALDRELEELGPFLSTHPAFARGTNVQLARVEGPDRLRIVIWERGVGRTAASGTSSCAATVAAVVSGRMEPGRVQVEMEGGRMEVTVTPELEVTLRGPVQEVARGRLLPSFLESLQQMAG